MLCKGLPVGSVCLRSLAWPHRVPRRGPGAGLVVLGEDWEMGQREGVWADGSARWGQLLSGPEWVRGQ